MHTLANRLLYSFLTGLVCALARLPARVAYWLGARLGDLGYLLLSKRRRITLENLALAWGEDKTPTEQRCLARTTFRHLGQHIIDFSRLRYLTPQAFTAMCSVEGLEHVDTLLSRQRGLLILSAHFGSWEVTPAVALCLTTPLHVIVRPLDHPAVHQLVDRHRRQCGYTAIPRQQALAASLRALRRGEIVAVLMDQSSLRHEAIQVEFFGVKAYTSIGPAVLALRAGCPVVSAFAVREAPGRHRLVFSPEIPLHRSGNLQQDIVDNTQTFTQVIEAYVRRYPEQWFWLHRRWKQRPA